MQKLSDFFEAQIPGDPAQYTLVVDPLHPENNSIPLSYFSGELSRTDIENADTRIEAATDDRPYFNLLERSLNPFPNGLLGFFTHPFADLPMGFVTFYITGFVALVYGALFVLIPLNFSAVGREKWSNKSLSMMYFSCLGAGFIIIEYVFIQMFMHVIGSPLYTVSTVLFVMLLSAGVGSYVSGRLKKLIVTRWFLPFLGVVATVLLILLCLPYIKPLLLGAPVIARVAFVFLIIFPTGFFLGMPFPLGISTLENKPKGAVAWAWGMNGLFTVIGGLLAVLLSIQWGFSITLLVACVFYVLALSIFSRIRTGIEASWATRV
jgi:hypothetical protein